MKPFDKEDYKKVKQYEDKFNTAINSRYITGMTQSDLKFIAEVYKGTLDRNVNLTCSSCVIQMLSSVGRMYFAYKENVKNKDGRNKGKGRAENKDSKVSNSK